MAIRIRPADLQEDRSYLIDLQKRNLSLFAGPERYDWLYLGSPHGKALAWIAVDEESGRGIGTAAAFPRKMYLGRSLCLGYVLGDFCIELPFRSLALALQLQRACLEGLDLAGSTIAYDLPSDRMMAIYNRMSIPTAGRYIRWAKLLRADRQIARIVKQSQLAKWLAAPVNQLIEWTDLLYHSDAKWKITKQAENCGEEFTRLASLVGSIYGTCVERSAEYLNWRFRKHPSIQHEILVARNGQELMGYVVFARTKEDARVVELFGVSDATLWTSLLNEVFRRLRAERVVTVSLPALETNPWVKSLRKLRFRERECTPAIVCPSREYSTNYNSAAPALFLTDGDRES
jgi:hypothetical protein